MPERHVFDRPWDSFTGYLFDIDGTLIHCQDAVHYFAFCEALTTVAGRSLNLDGVVTHGNVDRGILRDALTLAGVAEPDWRPRIPEMLTQMSGFVTRHQADLRAPALPGVPEVLRHLRRKGATLGVATGNLEQIGRLKLQAAGILDYFSVGGWSDAHETRTEVFRAAVALMPDGPLCVVGDTPADVEAAHVNHLPVIAVATGVFSIEALQDAGADLTVQSLGELLGAESLRG